ncbi:hypothetical protein [uncultured Clostridium sp.]|uniref:hypothetical protein n=1 Tax=uncultured Clostridium sp. TaxID=59620 RepID=UPI002620DA78|nr:hypothetical protein [uncultured Clostridium sp.]
MEGMFNKEERELMQSWLKSAIKQDMVLMDINYKKSWQEALEWVEVLKDDLENSEALELGLFMRRYCWLNVKSREDIASLKAKDDRDLIVKVVNMQKAAITKIEKEFILEEVRNYLKFLNEQDKNNITEIAETEEFIKDFETLSDESIAGFMYNLNFVFEDWIDAELRADKMSEIQIKVVGKVCDYVRYAI